VAVVFVWRSFYRMRIQSAPAVDGAARHGRRG
jgi:hypothetical protein